MDRGEARWIVDTIAQQKAEIERLRQEIERLRAALDLETVRYQTELKGSIMLMNEIERRGAFIESKHLWAEFSRANERGEG